MSKQPTEFLSVEDLVSTTSLGLRVLAGETGLKRSVLWAHSCEMTDPTEWLGPDELLMTVGLYVPSIPVNQVEFVRSLSASGLAGVILGNHETCPTVSHEMLEEANQLQFPVIIAEARTPWAAIARHVAAASASSQTIQVLKLSKLYQVAANLNDDYESLIQHLATLLGIGLTVIDKRARVPVLEGGARASDTQQLLRTYQLPSDHAAEVQIREFPGEVLDSFLLVHLLNILALNTDRFLGAIDQRVLESEHLFQELAAGKGSQEAIELLKSGTCDGTYRIASFVGEAASHVAVQVAIETLPVYIGAGSSSHLAFVPTGAEARLRSITEEMLVHVGISSPFSDLRDVRAGAEEALKILSTIRFSDRLWAEFEGTTVAVLTRSQREAAEVIKSVLGPLAGHLEAEIKLRTTLFAYLRNDRQWQNTADELGIHRQTLSYRLNRIEKETGLNVKRSADLSAFWIAYRAWEETHED